MSKTKCRIVRWVIACLCVTTSVTVIAEEDSIVVDLNTSDYIITYRSFATETGQVRVVWVPSTKINPAIKWNIKVSASKPDVLVYRYKFENGKTSQQAIEGGRLVASNIVSSSQATPTRWYGTVVSNRPGGSGFLVGWSYDVGEQQIGGIKPGATQGGFGFESTDLPGVGAIELWGSVPAGQSFPDEGPDELSPIRNQFVGLQTNDFVLNNAAIPRITIPIPFDANVVLVGIQQHVVQDLVGMNLIDTAFASQLARLLQSAADAAKRNNKAAVKTDIKELRRLLKEQHEDVDEEEDNDFDKGRDDKSKPKKRFIDRLAGRVLDFDLRYVERRFYFEDPVKH